MKQTYRLVAKGEKKEGTRMELHVISNHQGGRIPRETQTLQNAHREVAGLRELIKFELSPLSMLRQLSNRMRKIL